MENRHAIVQGPLLPGIVRLAGPAVGMMLMQGLYNFVDRFFVGRLGPAPLAGISSAAFVLWMTFAFAQLTSVGVAAKVARRIGEGDRAEADRTALRGVVYTTVWAAVAAIALWPAVHLLFDFMDTEAAVTAEGIRYLVPTFLGLPLIFLSFLINGIFSAAGDTRSPFIIMVVSLVANAILDPIMIFGLWGCPAMGIAGAAWATVLARVFWLILALGRFRAVDAHISLRRHGRLGLGLADWYGIASIGAPKMLTGFLFSSVYIGLNSIASRFGTPNVAALGIGHTYEGISFLSALGFSMAAATMVGQNLGASRPDRSASAAWITAGVVAAYTTVIGAAFLIFARSLGAIFTTDTAVIDAAAVYLTILAVSQPFMGVEIVLEGSFSGAGNTIPPMAIQLPLTLARYPIAYVLAIPLNLGVAGVWWAISGSSIVKCLIMAWWFRKNRWAETKI